MLLNILLGFILPWCFGQYLLIKKPTFAIQVSIIGALLAFLVNDVGFHMNWWYVTPKDYGTISFIPYNFGIFALFSVFTLNLINNFGRAWIVIPVMSLVKTVLESTLVFTGKVVYQNDWNLGFTYVSYLIPCTASYLIYSFLKKRTA
ncbi:hypothetical protein [Paenibacillus tianjinensis]|uniref:Uncharacterized protein n=1 Tax=Paenibacillus tianjinensis TaxID=2810347 RepID=A0ABX7LJ25_9BACL|nr:hypothetical protein [Paenibacillus tianjinensis]QSF46984.1 hypothetical protein JRJ22_10685 [Paenibacillus tianjinensis]